MKRLSNIIILAVLIFTLAFNTFEVHASNEMVEGNWNRLQSKYEVPLDKQWTIRFNRNMRLEEIDKIEILEDNISISLKTEIKDNTKIVITSIREFKPNTMYSLRIVLKNNNRYLMDFYTEENEILEIDFKNDNFIRIEANKSKGFNFPYYLFIPKEANDNSNSYILVEPNNTGMSDDNQNVHDDEAKRLLERGTPNRFARQLNIPLLIPSFPRPNKDWQKYTHSLDTDTMEIEEGDLKRIDLQLLNMVEDAKNILSSNNLNVNEKIFMSGYSASGNFTNRFVALHPEKVRAVASGGVNGMPIIPLSELDGHTLDFQVGIGNLKELTGTAFNLEEYKNVAQYIYMGALDRNDTLPYRDAYGKEEAELTELILGKDMLKDRWVRSQKIYQDLNISAQMVTYEGTDHEIRREMEKDIIEFFRKNGEIEKGINKIQPHEYDFVEYKELGEVNIIDVKWGDQQDAVRDIDGDKLVLFIEEWLEGQDYRQLSTFLKNLPLNEWNFTLKAEGYSDVKVHLNGWTFSSPDNRGFILELEEDIDKILPGVSYTIHPNRTNDKYYFKVKGNIEIIK